MPLFEIVMKTLFSFLLLGSLAFGQKTLISNDIHIHNHGGWGLQVNVGADKGDKIDIIVRCNYEENGECFVRAPELDGTPFDLVADHFKWQHWALTVDSTGDHFISAEYWWLGVDVLYDVHIVAVEAPGR